MTGIRNSVKHADHQLMADENTAGMSEVWWGQKSVFWSEAFDLVQNETLTQGISEYLETFVQTVDGGI